MNKNRTDKMKTYKRLRQRCVMPVLFRSWTPEDTLEVIRNVIESDIEWAMENVLADRFPRHLVEAEHRKDWSFGFCYQIAEVASIVFESAELDYESWFIAHAKKNVPSPFDSHWILKSNLNNSYFDCAKGANVYTAARMKNGSQPIRKGFMPQHPSKGAMHLFTKIVVEKFLEKSKQSAIAKKLLLDIKNLQERIRGEWYTNRNLPVPPAPNTPIVLPKKN